MAAPVIASPADLAAATLAREARLRRGREVLDALDARARELEASGKVQGFEYPEVLAKYERGQALFLELVEEGIAACVTCRHERDESCKVRDGDGPWRLLVRCRACHEIIRDFGVKGGQIPEWLDLDALPVALVVPEAAELAATVGESA